MSIRLLPVLPLLLVAAPALAADDGGKPSLERRYRYEHVEQDGVARNANAHTARLRLGYRIFFGSGVSREADGAADCRLRDLHRSCKLKHKAPSPQPLSRHAGDGL